MDEKAKMATHLSSAAAFVEGGIQDACEDACSICLEAFCESDPSTVTGCKHEYHLQCILEWCQRSSQCPMCWQSITLKDPTSQELLEAVEKERSFRVNQSRNATIFHHPALGDFELQHLPVGANDAELEERIIQHLAAAAMGRAHHLVRREGQRGRPAVQGRPQFLVFSAHPSVPPVGPISASSVLRGEENEPSPVSTVASWSTALSTGEEEPSSHRPYSTPAQVGPVPTLPSGTTVASASRAEFSNNRASAGHSSPVGQDRAGPSDLQSFSESLKSRLNAVSMRYKESITKSTRGWKERFFSRNNSVANLGSEVRREPSTGIATVSRMVEHLDIRENRRDTGASVSLNLEGCPVTEPSNPGTLEGQTENILNDNTASSSCAATSGSN